MEKPFSTTIGATRVAVTKTRLTQRIMDFACRSTTVQQAQLPTAKTQQKTVPICVTGKGANLTTAPWICKLAKAGVATKENARFIPFVSFARKPTTLL